MSAPPPPDGSPVPQHGARLADLSLARVEVRTDVGHAMLAMGQHVARRMLGLRRPGRAKVLPVVFAAIPFLPAIAFIGVAAILPGVLAGQFLPSPADQYPLISVTLVAYTALVSPQSLSPDRQHGTLSLLLASQLSRGTYLLSAAGALMTILLVVTVGPPLLVALGLALLDVPGPALLVVLWRALASGLLLAAVFGALGLAVSSLTASRTFAAAGTFVLLIGLGSASTVTTELLGWPAWTRLADVVAVGLESVARLNGSTGELSGVNGAALAGGLLGWILLPALLVWWRYRGPVAR